MRSWGPGGLASGGQCLEESSGYDWIQTNDITWGPQLVRHELLPSPVLSLSLCFHLLCAVLL